MTIVENRADLLPHDFNSEQEISYVPQLVQLSRASRKILERNIGVSYRRGLNICASSKGLRVSEKPDIMWDNFPEVFNNLDPDKVFDFIEIIVDFPIGHLESGLDEVDWVQARRKLSVNGILLALGNTNGQEFGDRIVPEMNRAYVNTNTVSINRLGTELLRVGANFENALINPRRLPQGASNGSLVLYIGENIGEELGS